MFNTTTYMATTNASVNYSAELDILQAQIEDLTARLAAKTEISARFEKLAAEAIDEVSKLEKKLAKKTTSAPKEQKATAKKSASKKQATKKSAPAEKPVGRPWNKLTKDEKHRLNAYAYRHLEECGGSWEAWEAKRLTLTFG